MRIAIAGYGAEGRANYEYYTKDLSSTIDIFDQKYDGEVPAGSTLINGADCFSKIEGYDLIIRTAGLSPSLLAGKGKIWSGTNEFFAKCPAPIIGVTGTKGKGTTASFITSILEEAGRKVRLLGNIGRPAISELGNIDSKDIVVYELSSFQLWDLEKSSHIAVVLMIEPDHLDVHQSFTEYIDAKSNISKHQKSGDIVIYHPTNEFSATVASAGEGQKYRYGVADDGQVYVKSNTFFVQDRPICSTDIIKLPGEHNLENACAAISATLKFTSDFAAIERGLAKFTGLPHRLRFVREVGGVSYYDDSIATTPGSAIAALKAFPDSNKILILGGHSKGADYRELVDAVRQTNSKIIAVGETGEDIQAMAVASGVDSFRVEGLMDEVVKKAAEVSSPGDVVILSPASSSFDQYQSYSDRGNKFIEAVERL